jgi:hypothetical protein
MTFGLALTESHIIYYRKRNDASFQMLWAM